MKVTLKLTDFGSARHLPHGQVRRLAGKQQCFDANSSPDHAMHQALDRQFMMTPGVCTAWYRAPELLSDSTTAELLDKPGAGDSKPTVGYGAAMDVWSYGAVVYELLTGGQQLARASHGAGLLRRLLQKLEVCPYPCFDAGDVPRYMTTLAWKSLYEAACVGDC